MRGDETALDELLDSEQKYYNDIIERKDNEIEQLKEQVVQITRLIKPEKYLDSIPSENVTIESLKDAVQIAKKRHENEIFFGPDVDESISQLDSFAGPPDKVLEYIEKLAELSIRLKKGNLGVPILKWFNDSNFTASSENEDFMNKKSFKANRTFSDGKIRRPFFLHLKPNNGVHPDKCVRIYFLVDESTKKITIGYIGRHPKD